MGSNGKQIENLGSLKRTHTCGELRPEHAGARAVVMGWVNRRRDFGPLTFIDLRDRAGVCQVVIDEERNPEAHRRAKLLRTEHVVAIEGKVVAELALPIAGLMSPRPFEEIEQALRVLRKAVAELGTPLHEPFLQMAFLALPVIPHLKITDKGLVDVDRFEVVN